jgi:hypothetical protein
LSNRPNELDKSKLSLGVAEQIAREECEQKRYKAQGEKGLAPPEGPGGAMWGHLVNGTPVGFPAGARQPS